MFFGGKGISQVDLAVAASILIVLFVFTVSHVSSYYSAPMQILETSKLRTYALNLGKTAFGNKGVPSDWHWKDGTTRPCLETVIWRVPVYLEEWNGTNYSDPNPPLVVEVPIDPGTTNGVANAWNRSIKAYEDGNPLTTWVDAREPDNSGFLKQFNVTFEVSLGGHENKTVFIYYSQDNLTSASYTSLTPTKKNKNVTVNITRLSERKLDGLTTYKPRALKDIPYQETKEKYGLERNFNLSVNSSPYSFSYGIKIPKEVSVEHYSNKVLFQNGTGFIKLASVEASVW